MKCPFCGYSDTAVKDSRIVEDDAAIRRRRLCNKCAARFTTYERVQLVPLVVLKKNGETETFDRSKLADSIYKALHKRNIDADRVETMVNSIVRQLETQGRSEIDADTIGAVIMSALKDLDLVAYVRFASVYCHFKTPEDFETFVQDLSLKEN